VSYDERLQFPAIIRRCIFAFWIAVGVGLAVVFAAWPSLKSYWWVFAIAWIAIVLAIARAEKAWRSRKQALPANN
jgi:hypothetical protein